MNTVQPKSRRTLAWLALACLLWQAVAALGGTLSDTPLSLKSSVPPNVLFALSVEYPTANTAAYQNASDYDPANEYLGLFDLEKCYAYDSDNGWFYPPSATLSNGHVCGAGLWSGNFLNWATMTGLDEFRYAMTGGNRYRDTATLTVLERTYQSGQGGTGNFANKTFDTSVARFQGALPFPDNVTTTGSIVNQGKGVQMQVSATMPTTITCTAWNNNSPYNCTAFSLAYNPASTVTCTSSSTWNTTTNKKICTSFTDSTSGETIGNISCKTTVTSRGVTGHCSVYNVKVTANPYSGQNYNVRAKVCDTTAGLESNCVQYGSSYKPTGAIQDNGDKMRFGVFSYYNANSINNAVMRSKLKYVAPQQYASAIGTVVNPNNEWSEADGTLVVNPDPAVASTSYGGAVSNSGVINYVNKFGSATHTYKTYDNIGKLYYEALAYLRNRAPDSSFYTGATTSNNDQFPVITSWDDPVIFACQKHYIIAMGDSHTHCDKKLPGGTYTSAQNTCSQCTSDYGTLSNGDTVSASTWTKKLGNLESRSNLDKTITGAGCASFYMSGLSYFAKATDIRPDNANVPATLGAQTVKTFVVDVQENLDQGVNSQFWYAAKYGGADAYDASGYPLGWATDGTLSWPKTLLKAGDPLSMISAVRSAFLTIRAGIGVESALAQSSGDLRTAGGAYIYQALFNSGGWIGDVNAFTIDPTGLLSSQPVWRASDWLAAHTPSERRIFSYNDGLRADGTAETGANARRGIEFAAVSTLANFSSRQQALLNTDEVGVTDNRGVARVNYLRGDASNEGRLGYQWRARAAELGDIVNSSPAYVGPPMANITGPGYGVFRLAKANRKSMVYVGGNDGMLHGFDASAPGTQGATPGQELMAYVPSAVYPNLSRLNAANYSHKFFVDGNPVHSEACFGACPTDGSGWKSMLVGGLNAGGQGIYALNISSPENFASVTPANLLLWEFTDRDDADLGYTFGDPIIKPMNNGKWAVIFGNGYNNTASDGRVSASGRAYLYIVFVDGPGAGNTWTLNTHYRKIELKAPGESATLPLDPPNGLSAPVAVDKNLNGTIDVIYVGDRRGNLWKIDVSSASPASWAVAFGAPPTSTTPLFSAQDSLGNAQQITSSVEVSRHPQGGFLVYFGTGSYIDTTDPLPDNGTHFNTQSFYGIWDRDNLTPAQRVLFSTITRSQLQKQAVLATLASNGDTFYFQSNCAPNYGASPANTFRGQTPDANCPAAIGVANASPQKGWVFDLPGDGERMIADRPLVQGGVVTFTTLTPASDPCTGNTVGRMYDLDYASGGRVTRGAAGVYDIDGNKAIDSADKFTVSALGGTVVAPSGKLLIGGASETPLRLRMPEGSAVGGGGGGGGGEDGGEGGGDTGATLTSTGGCTDFVAGWGCMSRMGRKPIGGSFMDFVSNQKLEGSGLLTTGGDSIDATLKSIPALSGRVSWREIMR